MPTTLSDLICWEQEKDYVKFVQILDYLTGDKYQNMRLRAVEVLGASKDPAFMILILREIARNPKLVDRIGAVFTTWEPGVIKQLEAIIDDMEESREIRWAAMLAIGCFEKIEVFKFYLDYLLNGLWFKTISERIYEIGLIKQFNKLIYSEHPELQLVALNVIRNSPFTQDSLDVLAKGLVQEDVQVRVEAFDILSELVQESDKGRFIEVTVDEIHEFAIGPAADGLLDDEALVRASSLRVIGVVKDEDSVGRVIELLDDESDSVRTQALVALRSFHHRGTKEKLHNLYLDEKNQWNIRRYSLIALGTCRDEGCDELLKNIFAQSESDEKKSLALDALLHLNPGTTTGFLVDQIRKNGELCKVVRDFRRGDYSVFASLRDMLREEIEPARIKVIVWLMGQFASAEDVKDILLLTPGMSQYIEHLAFAVNRILQNTIGSPQEYLSQIEIPVNEEAKTIVSTLIERWGSQQYRWIDPLLEELGIPSDSLMSFFDF